MPLAALTAARIPYRIVGGTRFFDRAEVKDCLAYLALAVNPSDGSTHESGPPSMRGGWRVLTWDRTAVTAAFDRAVNTPPREAGQVTLDQLHAGAAQAKLATLPYLRALPARLERWSGRLPGDGLRVN